MNRPMIEKSLLRGLAWSGVVLLSAFVALAQNRASQSTASGDGGQSAASQSGQRSDGQIEMDVVHALDAAQSLKNDLITAATIQSEVTLAGTVSSESSKKLAASIAAKVPGVTKVNNNLTVGDPKQAEDAMQLQPADAGTPDTSSLAQSDPAQSQQQADNQAYSQPQPQAPQQSPDQSQYPQQQGQYPQARPRYAPYGSQPQQPAYNQPAYTPAAGPVTLPQGTLLQLRTNEPVASKRATDGTPVQFTVISDVTMGGALAIPRGATVHGVVTEVKRTSSGDLGGSSSLALTLTSLDLGGQNYPLNTDQFKVKGPSKAGQTVGSAITGGLIGTIIGCAAGRGVGCAIGAGAGVAAGTAASAASSGPGVWIPAEALVSFHLAAPLTVSPVSQQEAARLAQGLYPGGPTLYQRPGYPAPYGRGYYAAYPYGYPPVSYHPYYMTGGYYYWR